MPPSANRVYGCPDCGTRVTGKEKECPKCGMRFEKGTRFACPSCGVLITRRYLRCPKCKIDLSKIPKETKTEQTKPAKHEIAKETTRLEPPDAGKKEMQTTCPNCSFPLDDRDPVCPRCRYILTGPQEIRCPICGTHVTKELGECPKCGVTFEKTSQTAEPMMPPDEVTPAKPSDTLSPEEQASLRVCPICGGAVPKGSKKCPSCDIKLPEQGAQIEVSPPGPETPMTVPPAETTGALGKIAPRPTRTVRKRVLKGAKVTTIPVASQSIARGRTNGIGQTNGVKMSAKGATNGLAFVNGTGIAHGPETGPAVSSAKRSSFITRWQFLAVLVALLVVIPTFVYLSYSSESSKIMIDGDFGDWDSATLYEPRVQSTAPTSNNIVEWSVAAQSSDLYFYLETENAQMSSSDPEGFYLLVDSDGSNSTGYTVESIGADYMLQLTGWDSVVKSSSLSKYSSLSDRRNWSAWTSMNSLSHSLDFDRLEAGVTMPEPLEQTARFILVSMDSANIDSVSYVTPLKGGILIVEQAPTAVAAYGLISKSASVAVLTLNFTCQGQDGQVSQINPSLVGAQLVSEEPPFSLRKGEKKVVTILLDTSNAIDGQLVAAKVSASGITSTFASVDIIGSGASVYAGSPPATISIDGAFADWNGRTSVDQDLIPVTSPQLDITQVGNLSTSQDSFFYVSVNRDICSGTYIPATLVKPSGSGGGAIVMLPRRTAEDTLNIFVDSDKSSLTGEVVTLNSKDIGADQKIEIKGLFGRITSMKEFDYSSPLGKWVESAESVEAAKDDKRIEIKVSVSSLGSSTDIDYIIETTSWKGRVDLASYGTSSMKAFTATWIVDAASTSPYATAMSYQRKMFHDGINYWIFYFDGADTVHKYSVDNGQTWTSCGAVFTTLWVNETSVWYDSPTKTIYAVGDTSSASTNVSIQIGTVNPQAHTISWAVGDSSLRTSTFNLAGKNTYITKDTNGFLWILSSNCTQAAPGAYQLSAFRSTEVNRTASWILSGQMLAATSPTDNLKGSIVPAGSGSDVWAVFAYTGRVDARKYNGIWLPQQTVYAVGPSKANTDNSPPSVVVDGKGVVHVVYGTGRKAGPVSLPMIEYSHNNTDLTTYTTGVNLDPLIAPGIGDYYPTISLDSSTDELSVLWIQSDATYAPKTVVAKRCISGAWSDMTIEQQTTFTKLYLTSPYSISDALKVGWQWTQNTTAPIEILFDGHMIPEFNHIVLPVLGSMVILAIHSRMTRWKKWKR